MAAGGQAARGGWQSPAGSACASSILWLSYSLTASTALPCLALPCPVCGFREFEEDQFLEFVAPCFQQLAALLSGASEFDSQLAAFSLLDLVVDRLAEGVRPYAPGLLALLPSVWQQAEGQSLLRIQVCVAGGDGGQHHVWVLSDPGCHVGWGLD